MCYIVIQQFIGIQTTLHYILSNNCLLKDMTFFNVPGQVNKKRLSMQKMIKICQFQ